MRIGVLAWGSLITDRRDLAIAEDFKPCGPHLPIEFCRISVDGRLTLVIDGTFGSLCLTYLALSAFGNLDAAMENLRVREGMPAAKGVGFVDTTSGAYSGTAMKRHPQAIASINSWAQANGFDAAIWTALASNFHETDKAAESFSVEAAIHYLEVLDAPKFAAALCYIRRAPLEVHTPVRAAVNARWPEG